MLTEALLLPAAYFLGSIPTGLLLARLFGGIDIRSAGSGNIGATNVYRTLGRKVGVLTLVGDCAKGIIPVMVAKGLELPVTWVAAVGLAAFIGHVYTVFLGFKGGKGVATALGVFLVLSPASVLLALLVFGGVLWKWRYVSLASITAAAVIPFFVALTDKNPYVMIITLCIAFLVIYKHRENIQRLRTGTESKFRA